MSLSGCITHLSGAVHGAGVEVTVIGAGPAATLRERLAKGGGHRQAMWEVGPPEDDGEGGSSVTRWRIPLRLLVGFLLSGDEERAGAMAAMAALYDAIRTAVLDAAAGTLQIVSIGTGAAREEPGSPDGALVMALPVTLRVRGTL